MRYTEENLELAYTMHDEGHWSDKQDLTGMADIIKDLQRIIGKIKKRELAYGPDAHFDRNKNRSFLWCIKKIEEELK